MSLAKVRLVALVTLVAAFLIGCGSKKEHLELTAPPVPRPPLPYEVRENEYFTRFFIREFRYHARFIYFKLTRAYAPPLLTPTQLEAFRTAIRETRLEFRAAFPGDKTEVRDRFKGRVAARGLPDPYRPGRKLIQVDAGTLDSALTGRGRTRFDVLRFVFHEYIQAAGIDDFNDRLSRRLSLDEDEYLAWVETLDKGRGYWWWRRPPFVCGGGEEQSYAVMVHVNRYGLPLATLFRREEDSLREVGTYHCESPPARIRLDVPSTAFICEGGITRSPGYQIFLGVHRSGETKQLGALIWEKANFSGAPLELLKCPTSWLSPGKSAQNELDLTPIPISREEVLGFEADKEGLEGF